ncbi:hypothetical protein SEA_EXPLOSIONERVOSA_50 [Mycobacterium phage ExplosioNervosa]|uniref:ribonucleoside reductase class II n=1 Tax=Mycobacterium phage Pioneer TaxID=1698417 RepID=UPI0006BC50D9|nr:ribonucleoside reductase class II [Mycobacterium phage Pioneer]ALA07861.1 hypothetical protein SEA_PIONEER_50 [Mycobacterium phage Pioneer]AVI04183.1 hypothetical protein SEA_PHONNEGUT_50 [Mycobacterium phage Phonnegut]AZF93527.1 hypothetical protein SEA_EXPLOSIONERVOSA_50 [Mycobacterium phage ExplosioNervosa]QGJ88701.1 hypothetical protein SEA_BEEMO_50 [Mycobacterium phage Beemo]
MSYEDPFATAPADDEAQAQPVDGGQPATTANPVPAPQPAAQVVNVSATGDLSVTFKGDGSYSAPWIVPKYTSVDQALVDLGVDPDEVAKLGQGQKWFALFDRAAKMNQHFATLTGGGKPATTGGGGGGQRQAPPKAATEAPNGEKKFCKHGEMEYKSGTSKKTGKPYALFSCTAPRDEQCDAQWPSK